MSKIFRFRYFNIYEFDFSTKQKRRILNNNRFLIDDLLFDNDLNLRIIGEITSEGGKIIYRPSDRANVKNLTSSTSDWTVYTTVSPEDYQLTAPIFFSSDNSQIYWIWGPDSDLGKKQHVLHIVVIWQLEPIKSCTCPHLLV